MTSVKHAMHLLAFIMVCREDYIWFVQDPSHFIKKCTNNLEKSHVRVGSRRMMLPEPLVKMVLSQVDKSFTSDAAGSADASCNVRGRPTLQPCERPPGQAARCGGARTSEGEE